MRITAPSFPCYGEAETDMAMRREDRLPNLCKDWIRGASGNWYQPTEPYHYSEYDSDLEDMGFSYRIWMPHSGSTPHGWACVQNRNSLL